MAGLIEMKIRDAEKVSKGLRNAGKDAAKGVSRAINRVTYRGTHTEVKRGVTKVWNVSQKDVNTDSRHSYRKHGGVSVFGVKIPTYNVEYYGTEMSFARKGGGVRFGLTPTKPVAARVANDPVRVYNYAGSWEVFPSHPAKRTVKWKPKRSGGRMEVKSPTGNPTFVSTMNGATTPWARTMDKQRKPVRPAKTGLSVPQMIEDGETKPPIMEGIEARLGKELSRIRI